MNRIGFVICVAAIAFLAACSKSPFGIEQYRAQARIDDEIVQKYIADNNLQDVAEKIDTSGVYCIVLKPGSGNSVFTNSTTITVGYTARLLTTGDTVYNTGNIHPSYVLGNIIKAWQLGIPKVQEGGQVRIISPSRYAYGPYDQPNSKIPKNSVLDFLITLYDVKN
jgi:FKBP-type peptidyl-prolyl cis-trans isomerase FkpA